MRSSIRPAERALAGAAVALLALTGCGAGGPRTAAIEEAEDCAGVVEHTVAAVGHLVDALGSARVEDVLLGVDGDQSGPMTDFQPVMTAAFERLETLGCRNNRAIDGLAASRGELAPRAHSPAARLFVASLTTETERGETPQQADAELRRVATAQHRYATRVGQYAPRLEVLSAAGDLDGAPAVPVEVLHATDRRFCLAADLPELPRIYLAGPDGGLSGEACPGVPAPDGDAHSRGLRSTNGGLSTSTGTGRPRTSTSTSSPGPSGSSR